MIITNNYFFLHSTLQFCLLFIQLLLTKWINSCKTFGLEYKIYWIIYYFLPLSPYKSSEIEIYSATAREYDKIGALRFHNILQTYIAHVFYSFGRPENVRWYLLFISNLKRVNNDFIEIIGYVRTITQPDILRKY